MVLLFSVDGVTAVLLPVPFMGSRHSCFENTTDGGCTHRGQWTCFERQYDGGRGRQHEQHVQRADAQNPSSHVNLSGWFLFTGLDLVKKGSRAVNGVPRVLLHLVEIEFGGVE